MTKSTIQLFLLACCLVLCFEVFWQDAVLSQSKPAKAKPGVKLNVRDFAAAGDGTTKDTSAIQQAIDRAYVMGGGEVLVPAGKYLTGAIALKSNVTLRLDRDAIIFGTPDFADYPVTQVRCIEVSKTS